MTRANSNFKDFKWKEETEIENAQGQKLIVRPMTLLRGHDEEPNERAKECYRLYETEMGILSELEIKHWQAGGPTEERELFECYQALFDNANEEKPLREVIQELRKKEFPEVLIEVVVGWLIKGQFVKFNPKDMTITRSSV